MLGVLHFCGLVSGYDLWRVCLVSFVFVYLHAGVLDQTSIYVATIPWYSPDYEAGRDFYFSLSPMTLYLHHIILSLV